MSFYRQKLAQHFSGNPWWGVYFIYVSLLKRILLVLLSALLGVLCFPPISFSFLSVVAWFPLLLGISGAPVKVATRLGVLHGLVFYGATLSWLTEVFEATPYMVVPLVFMMASFTGVFCLLVSYSCSLYRVRWWYSFLYAALWTGIEFFRAELFPLGFPWMTPGLGLGPTVLTPIIGVYGGGFLIVLGCSLLIQDRQRKWGLAVLILMLVASVLVKPDTDSGQKVRVLALQSENGFLESYLEMIAECEKEVEVILLPEYAFGRDVRESKHIWRALTDLATARNAIVIVGTMTEVEDYWYNTALSLTDDGVAGVHYKNYPVHFFDDGRAGEEAKSLQAKGLSFGTPICFDNDYEGVVRRMTADGATFFAVPSLDAESWTEREHWQHAELFRHRAAENGRWMVVSTGSGITQLIDAHGVRREWLKPMENGWMHVELPIRTTQTVYTRFGWLFPWAMLTVSGAWIVILVCKCVQRLWGCRRN
ncbi:MAG: nitrilase-related carbon-nitrogen hydrolase [Rubritalea sp.]|uniref:apolipoprotein N-acyltransferase n=1 Tax=Rubritalea sp. TaxID=2109375 RepID=UPI0032427B17